MKENFLSRIYLISLLLLMGILMVNIATPFIHALIFAFIASGLLIPYNEKIYNKLKIHRGVSAIIVCLLFVIILLIPFVIIITQSSGSIMTLYGNVTNIFFNSDNNTLFDDLVNRIVNILAALNIEVTTTVVYEYLNSTLNSLTNSILNQVNALTGNIFNFLMQFVMMLLIMYGILTYGYILKKYLLTLIPESRKSDFQMLIDKFNELNYNTFLSNMIVAIIQGSCICVLMYFLGFKSLLLWGLLIAISSFIPILSIYLICVPISIFFIFNGQTTYAIILMVFAIVISTVADNYVKPKIIGHGARINPLLMLLCIIGAMTKYGIYGIFYGPLVLGVFLSLLELFKSEIVKD